MSTFAVRRAADWDGTWEPAASLDEALVVAKGMHDRAMPDTIVLVCDPTGSVDVYQTFPPAFALTPSFLGSYEKFYGRTETA